MVNPQADTEATTLEDTKVLTTSDIKVTSLVDTKVITLASTKSFVHTDGFFLVGPNVHSMVTKFSDHVPL